MQRSLGMVYVHLVMVALRSLLRRPLPSVLVAFAWTSALAATMTIMAVLQGAREQVRKDMEAVGNRVLNIHIPPLDVTQLIRSSFRPQDADLIRHYTGGPTAPFHVSLGTVRQPGGTGVAALFLVTTPEWAEVVPTELLAGRFLTSGDQQACVLDEAVAVSLFGPKPESTSAGSWAVGRLIELRGPEVTGTYRVVGVARDPFQIRRRLAELDFGATARPRVLRIMEYQSVYLLARRPWRGLNIHGFVSRVAEGRDVQTVEAQVRRALAGSGKRVYVWARLRWIRRILMAMELSTEVAHVSWAIVLIITSAMVFSIALVAVRSRVPELAIRCAEGARPRQVAFQLLVESMLLCLVGWPLAVAVARLASLGLEQRYLSWPTVFRAEDLLTAGGCGLLAALLATAGPAFYAARRDPVAVLQGRA